MLASMRARLTYANVTATLAIFIALGGSSYAALKITGKDVKNASLTGADVKDNSLSGKDVRGIGSADVTDHSLLANDFKAGELPAGAAGATGQQGPKGDTGLQGPPGPTAGTAGGDYEDPPAGPTVVLAHSTIHTSSPGRIYAQASMRFLYASCTFTSTAPGATSRTPTMTRVCSV